MKSPPTSTAETPFVKGLKNQIRKFIRSTKADGTLAMNVENLKQCVRTPAARIVERLAAFEALESALEIDKKDLIARNKAFYFQNAHGKVEVPSSISVPYENGEVLVTFTSRYKALPDESSLVPILGENVAAHFRQSFEIKIDGDKLPADKAQELVEKLQELFGSYNALDALSNKEVIKPNAEFHAKRHLVLSTEQNLALEDACPMTAMVKTKGRK